jgi:hypothetical protein
VNFGKEPSRCFLAPPNYTEGCSNTTHCPPSKGPYLDCLKIGQVLTVPIAPACVPRPGAWECKSSRKEQEEHGDGRYRSWGFFCDANRRAFPGCRSGEASLGECPPDELDPTLCDLITANQTVKVPTQICVPNDKSYCIGTNSTVTGDIYHGYD